MSEIDYHAFGYGVGRIIRTALLLAAIYAVLGSLVDRVVVHLDQLTAAIHETETDNKAEMENLKANVKETQAAVEEEN